MSMTKLKKIHNPKVFLSSNISIILDYHKQLDKINEAILTSEKKLVLLLKVLALHIKIKCGRKSIKLYDLKSKNLIEEKIQSIKKFYDPILDSFGEVK